MVPSADDIKKAISKIGTERLPPKSTLLSKWLRISDKKHSGGLGFAKGASSRFSDPRPSPVFGVVYLAPKLGTAVAEAIVRDRKDGNPGILKMSYDEAVGRWRLFEISTSKPLRLLNLSDAGMMYAGIPTDIVRKSDHTQSRLLSVAVHDNPANFDGILFPSRFFGTCLCVYDRALPKLWPARSILLSGIEGNLAPIFRSMGVQVVR